MGTGVKTLVECPSEMLVGLAPISPVLSFLSCGLMLYLACLKPPPFERYLLYPSFTSFACSTSCFRFCLVPSAVQSGAGALEW